MSKWEKLDPLHNGSAISSYLPQGRTMVVAGPVEAHLIDFLENQDGDTLVACCAWFTSKKVIDCIAANFDNILVIVQKEEFLRPDQGKGRSYYEKNYSKLHNEIPLRAFGDWNILSDEFDKPVEPVRCMGYGHATSNKPRMHHKFFLCGHTDIIQHGPDKRDDYLFMWESLWLGSFNATLNGAASRDTAAIFEGHLFDEHYQAIYKEFRTCLLYSESLDWDSEYIEPEYREGT